MWQHARAPQPPPAATTACGVDPRALAPGRALHAPHHARARAPAPARHERPQLAQRLLQRAHELRHAQALGLQQRHVAQLSRPRQRERHPVCAPRTMHWWSAHWSRRPGLQLWRKCSVVQYHTRPPQAHAHAGPCAPRPLLCSSNAMLRSARCQRVAPLQAPHVHRAQVPVLLPPGPALGVVARVHVLQPACVHACASAL